MMAVQIPLTVGLTEGQRSRLAFEPRTPQRIVHLVVWSRLVDAAAQLLGEKLQASCRLVQKYAKSAVGLLQNRNVCFVIADFVSIVPSRHEGSI